MKNTDLTHEQLLKKVEELEKIQDDYAMLNEITYNMFDMVALFSMEGKIKYASPSYKRVLGYQPEVGQDMMEYVHPEDKENLLHAMTKFIKDHVPQTQELRLRKADGSYLYVETISNIRKNEVGEITGFITNTRDISERKDIKKESNLLAEMLDNAPNSITVHDNSGKFLFANKKTFEIHGYSKEEFMSLNLRQLDVPESAELIQERINTIHENGQGKFEVEHYKKDGSIIPLEVYVKFVDWKGKIAMLSIATDISERKKAEQKLTRSEQRFKLATQSAELGIWDWNVKENIMIWDEKMFDLYGIKKETFVNTVDAWMSGLHPDDKDRAIAECNDSLKGMKDFNTTFRVLQPDGKVLYIKADGLVLRDSSGEAIRMIGVNRDISESKQNEIELKSAKEQAENANRLKTEFLHNMSHEIRTPLNGIMGFSEILNKQSISEEKRNNYSSIVRNSSQQLLRIIDDILEISELETKQTKLDETEFCLNDFLMELYAIFSLKSGNRNVPIYIEKPLHDKEIQIISDKTKLNKILSNLIENAIKYTTRGSIEIGYNIEKDLLKLYVRDTGIGISAKNQQKIFERFSQEDNNIAGTYGGLGLGLSICKENAQLLGGDITLESQKGSGSTFIVNIPYKPAGNNAPETMKPTSEGQSTEDKPVTILVAEDEEMNYLYIEALFEDELEFDCNLIHAKDGKEALDICMKNQNIDLVLMDIKMPVMNGNTATLEIKKKFPDLPVIAQTAYSTESEKREAMKHGYDDFMSKPLDSERLFETINKYVKIQ